MRHLAILAGLLLLAGCAPTMKTVSLGPLSITSQPAAPVVYAPQVVPVYRPRPVVIGGYWGHRGRGWHRGWR
jgi:hypothetical protein